MVLRPASATHLPSAVVKSGKKSAKQDYYPLLLLEWCKQLKKCTFEIVNSDKKIKGE